MQGNSSGEIVEAERPTQGTAYPLTMAGRSLAQVMMEVEAAYLCQALEAAGGVKRRAAQVAGISETRLYEKLRHHGIRVEAVAVRAVRGQYGN